MVEKEVLNESKHLEKEMKKLFKRLSIDIREYLENQELTKEAYDSKQKIRMRLGLLNMKNQLHI